MEVEQARVSPSEPTQDAKWYLPDGDVVLHATDAQSAIRLFRVHKAILAHHSAVFAGLFTLPTNGATNETYEGAPIIQMQDDADDLAELIGALYDPDLPLMRPLDPANPARARGAMRLARKYDVDAVRTRIVQRLEADWPKDVIEWLRLCADVRKRTELRDAIDRMYVGAPSPEPAPFVPEPASAVRFAREFDVPSILPAAFYALALTDVRADWDAPGARRSELFAAARWTLLDATDVLRVARGKALLCMRIVDMVGTPLLSDQPFCASCATNRLPHELSELWQSYLSTQGFAGGINLANRPDMIGLYSEFLELLDTDFAGLCARHMGMFRSFFPTAMDARWRQLPGMFEL
ncbi:BTB domain-containing protein [Phanerochaete sordida]|uniref:BTB domain-containing protein n=1 Tax=Phanerochaete sordida TaxID=48140 RepID=A0A9P3LIW9_9APHY|nr:BTB domain-containing protein [Phanerochaete sordida]